MPVPPTRRCHSARRSSLRAPSALPPSAPPLATNCDELRTSTGQPPPPYAPTKIACTRACGVRRAAPRRCGGDYLRDTIFSALSTQMMLAGAILTALCASNWAFVISSTEPIGNFTEAEVRGSGGAIVPDGIPKDTANHARAMCIPLLLGLLNGAFAIIQSIWYKSVTIKYARQRLSSHSATSTALVWGRATASGAPRPLQHQPSQRAPSATPSHARPSVAAVRLCARTLAECCHCGARARVHSNYGACSLCGGVWTGLWTSRPTKTASTSSERRSSMPASALA